MLACDSQSIMGDDDGSNHELRTPNEGINQRNPKIWDNVADKYASAVLKNFGVEVDFRPCSEGDFLTGHP